MKKQILSDPYAETSYDVKVKVQTWFPHAEVMFLAGINPVKGSIQYVINNLLKGLIDECRTAGITDYSRVDEFVAIVNRRSAFSLPPNGAGTETEVRNDGGGDAHVAPPPAEQQNLRADPPKRGAKGVSNKKGKGRAKG